MNNRHPISFFSHYSREDSKISLSRQMHKEVGYDCWDVPGVKGLYIGDGYIGVATAEDHPLQGEVIPTELKDPNYKNLPVVVEYHGYSYHLTGQLDHMDDARYDAYALQGRRGGGGGGTSGSVQGGTQIVCDQEYGTCTGVFVDSSQKQSLMCSWHVIQKCKGTVNKGSGNRNSPQSAGAIAKVGKNGCGCGGGSGGAAKKAGWADIGYGLGAVTMDYPSAYRAEFGRDINDIPYIGRRPLEEHHFQRGGGGGGRRGGGRGGNFYIDGCACPMTVKGSETILGLGAPKGFRPAKMGEKLTYLGVRSGSKKTFPVTGLNYTDRGGVCGTCTDMVVCYPCPLPGDSGASYWGTDGFLVAIVTDGSNDKGGNNCTSYNCSIYHVPECFGLNIRNAQTPMGPQQTYIPGQKIPEVTGKPLDDELVQAQQKRLKAYMGITIS